MSEDLDRKIAELVMGEEEPSEPPPCEIHGSGARFFLISPGKNWRAEQVYGTRDGVPGIHITNAWIPLPFSSVLREAFRAFDKWALEVVEDVGGGPHPVLCMEYHTGTPGLYMAKVFHLERWDEKLEVAICNLLLALRTDKA